MLFTFLLQTFQIKKNFNKLQKITHQTLVLKINIYRKCTAEPYSYFVNDTTLTSNNPLRFRKNFFSIYNKNHDN